MKKKILTVLFTILAVAISIPLFLAYGQRKKEFAFHKTLPKTIELRSEEFVNDGKIPVECSGKGGSSSPSLHWSNLPKGTRSLVLVVTDYDGPAPFLRLTTVDHWIVYNIPATTEGFKKGVTNSELQNEKISQGENYTKGVDYAGPKPPLGVHRYYFRIYALSTEKLNLTTPKKEPLMEAISASILGYGELIGKF